ncbi:MAG: hypothetical protein RL538_906 [Candidatus Parcubacteria bacterium]|jgi:large subunit ribosomal protein L9
MKVILLRDVAKIGRRNDIVDLPDGYALNQLIPKKWAEAATPANIKKITTAKAAVAAHHQADDVRFEEMATMLQKERITLSADANANGHLFKAIHESDIISAAAQKGVTLDKTWVHPKGQIKELGVFDIFLKRAGKEREFQIEVVKK